MERDERRDERIDEAWDGPTPDFETYALIAPDVSREELLVYFSHVIAQLIDARTEMRLPLALPEDSPWQRDWATISAMGVTEEEVSFLLSDIDGDALTNMATLALGLAIDRTLEQSGPSFTIHLAASMLGIVANGQRGEAGRP